MEAIKSLKIFAVALALMACAGTARAQKAAAPKADELARTRAELVESTEAFKAGTRELIRLKEAAASKAQAAHEELSKLVAEGLIARVKLEESAQALARTRAEIEELQKQLASADHLLAEVEAAEEAAKEAAAELAASQKAAAAAKRLLRPTARFSSGSVIIRHTGAANWSLSGIAGVQTFFSTTFGRPLPVSAFGQTATHDRLGYDHRRAVDVALHPDSPEGRALIDYLLRNGITFIAFRSAVPGSATGPHIHIGPPSHRL